MTLFEIAISLAILSTAVLTVALSFPVGVRAQRLARFQIYASAKVLEIIDAYVDEQHLRKHRQVESQYLAQNTAMQWVPDIDRKMEDPNLGLLPLPRAIAQRLDSDGDEIARLIADGGRIFFCTPMSYGGTTDQVAAGYFMTFGVQVGQFAYQAVAQNQSLLIGVIGNPQQNALPNHPCVAWPYQDWYPSPVQERERLEWLEHGWTAYAEFEQVYNLVSGPTYEAVHRDPLIIDEYIRRAQALVLAAGVATSGQPGFAAPTLPPALPTGTWTDTDLVVFPPPWRILAMRCLAHAAMARTAAFPNPADDASAAQRAYAVDCHEAALAWATRYASTSIYDWGAPRPLNRQTAFDFPLLQYDLFSPLNTSAPGGDVSHLIGCPLAPNVAPANVWRSHGNYGWNPMPDNRAQIAAGWSDNRAFNLTAPFSASDRTRRIVCWSADWQAYEDFEELPAEATSSDNAFLDSLGVQVSAERTGYPPGAWFHFEDAARSSLFDVALHTRLNQSHYAEWNTATYKAGYLGVHGADRNGDGDFDRGPLPRSARMRATTVVQYDVYDRRLLSGLHY